MVDLEVLKAHGYSPEALKAKFTAEDLDPKIKLLVDLNARRIDECIQRNMNDARTWFAIDTAYDASQRQITFTLVDGLLSKGMSSEDTMEAMKQWGLTNKLTQMLTPFCNKDGSTVCDANGKPRMKLDLPTFFHIFVPLVQAYTKMRWAKLFNDRDIYPLYKYEPVSMTTPNRLRCEIITSRIQRMAQEMGYREDERQSILQMLKYGVCLNFPAEDFYKESQTHKIEGKEVDVVVKEGVRFEIPHPSRSFYDMNHRLTSANFDTGVEYAGFWNVLRFREVKNNTEFWNTDQIQFKYGSWVEAKYNFFRELNPCMLKFPQAAQTFGPGSGDSERTKEAFRYTTHHEDEGVTVVSFFHKLIPSEWNLFDYDKPVWMRFVHIGSHTVCHAVPLAYNPLLAYLYDADAGNARPASLALEILPFQDHLSNLLTQYLLTVKQNLERIVFWNSDIVDQKYVDQIANLGEKKYRGTTFIPYSKRELNWQQQDTREAFTSVEMPDGNTAELSSSINNLIGMMERVLGYSSQEVGVPATHEQTAQEVEIISANTSNRLQFTGSFIDTAIRARKKLLYEAMMAYSTDEVIADVADMTEERLSALKDLGFTIDHDEARGSKAGIRGSKADLRIDGFASDREGADRIVDTKLAATMIQTFQSIFSNPTLAEAAGLEQLMDLFNQILVYSGAPKDFRLRVQPHQQQNPQGAQQQQAEFIKQMQQQMAEMASKIVDGKLVQLGSELNKTLVEPMKAQAQETAQALQELAAKQSQEEQAIDKIFQILQAVAQRQTPNATGPTAPPNGGGLPPGPGMVAPPGMPPPA